MVLLAKYVALKNVCNHTLIILDIYIETKICYNSYRHRTVRPARSIPSKHNAGRGRNNMSKICNVEGCSRTDIQGHGWCQLHYNRWRRTGNPEKCLKYHEHGMKGTPEHNSWSGMKQRCYYKEHKQYKDYGGRGIKVCDRWLGPNGFENFLKDMGNRPEGDYSLDRIDVDGDYEPNNCRWANRYEQSGNRNWGKQDSKIAGVYKYNDKYWRASIGVKGKTIAKYAKTEKEAIAVRRQLEKKYL